MSIAHFPIREREFTPEERRSNEKEYPMRRYADTAEVQARITAEVSHELASWCRRELGMSPKELGL